MNNTARAHTNIALIKYWGKKDADLRLPLMSSISMTLDAFYTDTNLVLDTEDKRFYLNGELVTGKASERVISYVERLQKLFHVSGNFHVISQNHVPTSAGLASSSSAFAALAASFVKAYQLDISKKGLSILARLGSGSATRSIFGGFAIWHQGQNSATSFGEAIDETPEMDLRMIAVELNTKQKKISSTQGMEMAKTSPFFIPWIHENEAQIIDMKAAIENNDFTSLGELAEQNASQMHAVNLACETPFTYFEPETVALIHLVQDLRKQGLECYYTIDAGPNVKILTELRNSKEIQKAVKQLLPTVKIVESGFGPGIQYLNEQI
ncbi:diphosphomevalonate decarboxylase [Lactobacillus psittaci]|nr:diphosphomevalonate decarboxylase [Lactobacillus psittaci]